jgi:hypothetical protein
MLGLVWLFGAAIVILDLRDEGTVDAVLAAWVLVAAFAAAWPFVAARRGSVATSMATVASGGTRVAAWLPVAVACIVGWQALIIAYSRLEPVRSSEAIVAAVRGRIGPDTALFTVGQYRHSVAFYLGRTLRVADYRGELEFGLEQEDRGYLADLQAFATEWADSSDAVAFIDPGKFAVLRAAGLPGRVLAEDQRSIVVSRR